MSLYRTELRRLGKRRFARWMTLLGLLVLGVVLVGIFLTNHKIGPAEQAEAQRQAQQQYQEQVRWAQQERTACEQAKASGQAQDGRYPPDCEMISPPPPESVEARWFLPSTFDFRASFGDTITAFTAILALVGFVVGASYVGAEWSSGGMMNLLLWRPQRLRVLLTKLAALLSGLLAVTLPAAVLWTAGFWLIGTLRGTTAKTTSGVWQSFALTGLRGLALIAVATTIGFALASLGRHTAMALGGAIGLVVVGQFGLGIVLSMAGTPFVEAWLLPTYGLAWMDQKVTLENWQSCNTISYGGECKPDTLELTWQHSAILLTVGLVLALGAALVTMRRRDIA
ncbi:ABC transporter permease subunit [Micromonospora olivasterospora]|uniref:ABC-type transport system involved in multi-copper enzyme maturation permease subunit n=1 Tax=Micromonospora olivasterospora TaxID=1880 RepID=A0A562I7C2_MICOL|nr:ABC transporter permease subunit [Micromonospora olivasterospora]TWH66889.1 ABC-type transport system involved in multi-copper enzyme maturation permease subunit [Micromonospora olivasterospora]